MMMQKQPEAREESNFPVSNWEANEKTKRCLKGDA